MNSKKLADLIVTPAATVREVMQAIDRTGVGMAVVCEPGRKLRGVITDGDVRRSLLRGASLDTVASTLMNPTPVTTSPASSEAEVLQIMNDRGIRHILVTVEDEVIDLVNLTDLARELRPPLKRKAVVMAGGMGTRLGQLTKDTPKPLLHVGGKPIIERIVDHLRDHGVEDVIITTRHLGDQIEDHFADRAEDGISIDYVRERERLGTAGALKYLEGEIEESFLVMNGDLLTGLDLRELVRFHDAENAIMTVGVKHFTFRVPFGVMEHDGSQITGLSEKPTFDFIVNAGIYVLEPEALRHIPSEQYFDITQLIERLIEAGERVTSFPIVERWLDIGRPEDLERARSLYEEE